MVENQLIHDAIQITKLINQHIQNTGCGDPTCDSCKMGIALGEEDAGYRLDHIDEAYNQGHRDGFKAGKEQRDHDIKRALEEMDEILTSGPFMDINEVKAILKKYTEA